MGRRVQVRLAAGQEPDSRQGGRHDPAQAAQRLPRHGVDAGLFGRVVARDDHVCLQHDLLGRDPVLVEGLEGAVQEALGDLELALDRVLALHLDLGLDDGDEVELVGEGRDLRDAAGVRDERALGGKARPYARRHPPLDEGHALLAPVFEPLRQPVEAAGHVLVLGASEELPAGGRRDAEKHSAPGDELDQRSAVAGPPIEHVGEDDDARQVLAEPRRAADHLLEVGRRLLGPGVDRLAPPAPHQALERHVGREDAFARGDHTPRGRGQGRLAGHAPPPVAPLPAAASFAR